MDKDTTEAIVYIIIGAGLLIKWVIGFFYKGSREKVFLEKMDEMTREFTNITDYLKKAVDLVRDELSLLEKRQNHVEREWAETRSFYAGLFEKQSQGSRSVVDPPTDPPPEPDDPNRPPQGPRN